MQTSERHMQGLCTAAAAHVNFQLHKSNVKNSKHSYSEDKALKTYYCQLYLRRRSWPSTAAHVAPPKFPKLRTSNSKHKSCLRESGSRCTSAAAAARSKIQPHCRPPCELCKVHVNYGSRRLGVRKDQCAQATRQPKSCLRMQLFPRGAGAELQAGYF